MHAGKIIICPQCGNTVAATDRFCSKCYTPIQPPSLWRKFLSLFQFARQSKPLILNIKKTVTIRTTGEDGQAHEYHSLDEVPPGMRAEIEKLESEVMKEKGNSVSFTETSKTGNAVTAGMISRKSVSVFKLKDASGAERIYYSLDELPPEIREAVRRAQNHAGSD